MKYKVDTKHGYIFFSNKEESYRYFNNNRDDCIRLLECKDIYDDGKVLAGAIFVLDLTENYNNGSN